MNTNRSGIVVILGLVAIFLYSGCGTQKYAPHPVGKSTAPVKIALQEGDVVKVVFPDASNLNTIAKVMRDGTITLPLVGDVRVVGMTTAELEKALLTKYADQIVSKEINVSVESSSFQVYITGAVTRPGKIQSDRALTVLEAILEAGGVDYSRANLKGVIIRRKGLPQAFKVDVQSMMTGRSDEVFDLQPNDIIFVPEKFSWY